MVEISILSLEIVLIVADIMTISVPANIYLRI